MKKIIYQITILIAIILIIVSCDKVKDVRDPNAEAIKGNRKVILSVDFWYDSKGLINDKAIVELWGRH